MTPDTVEAAEAWLARLDAMHPFAKDLSWSHHRERTRRTLERLRAEQAQIGEG